VSVSDLFWVFFIFAAVQPWVRQRLLDGARQKLMAAIERERKSRLILLVHRQETMAFLGFPLMRYIDLHDWEDVVRAIDLTDEDMPIDLVLHTPGGLVLASVQIARAIKMHRGRVTVFVPHYAMSGGTLIALAADEIVMSEHAVLGPVDPQLGQYSAASVLSVLDRKPVEKIDDQTLILADQGRKAIAQVSGSVKELLGDTYPPEKVEELARLLSTGTWTHDHPITCAAARTLGLRVSSEMPKPILRLMELFPQPVRRHAAVEYLPGPRHMEPPAAKR
jgi:ClpP class serine protease